MINPLNIGLYFGMGLPLPSPARILTSPSNTAEAIPGRIAMPLNQLAVISVCDEK